MFWGSHFKALPRSLFFQVNIYPGIRPHYDTEVGSASVPRIAALALAQVPTSPRLWAPPAHAGPRGPLLQTVLG